MSLHCSSSLKSKYILLQANKKEQGSGDGKPEGSKSPSCSGSDYGVDGKACSFFSRLFIIQKKRKKSKTELTATKSSASVLKRASKRLQRTVINFSSTVVDTKHVQCFAF